MRISDALSPARELTVPFQSAELHVTYRPISYTMEQLDEIQAKTEETGGSAEERRARLDRVLDIMTRLVVSWDLTDDEDVVINPENRDAMRKIPMNVFTEILAAVRKDQSAGEA